MKVLLIRPPLGTVMKLEQVEREDMNFFYGHNQKDCMEIASDQDVDLIVAFMRFPDAEVHEIINNLVDKFPGKKIIGLVDAELSTTMGLMEPSPLEHLSSERIPYYN